MSKITFGCCLAGGSFMPEGVAAVPSLPDETIIHQCRTILSAGYDYTECAAAMLTKLTEEEFNRVLEVNEKESLKLRACNSLISGDFPIVGADADYKVIGQFLDLLLSRMHALGAVYAVFGSGRARCIPEGQSKEETLKQLVTFMDFFAKKAEKYGIILAIEPLRLKETDMFNTVDEAAETVRACKINNLKIIADSFHMCEMNTPPERVLSVKDVLVHCHISEPITRAYPGSEDSADRSYNPRFAKALKDGAFSGTVTVECRFDDFENNVVSAKSYLDRIFTF